MNLHLTCLYCDHKWTLETWRTTTKYTCTVCKDKNIKVKELNEVKVDYYQGSPAFAEKKDVKSKEKDDPYGSDYWSSI